MRLLFGRVMAQCMESESKTWQFAPARWSWRRPYGHCAIDQYSLVLEFWAKESEASGIFPNSRSPKTGVLLWVLLRAGHLLKMTLFQYHWPVTHAWFPSLVSKSFVWTMCAFGRCCWWSFWRSQSVEVASLCGVTAGIVQVNMEVIFVMSWANIGCVMYCCA